MKLSGFPSFLYFALATALAPHLWAQRTWNAVVSPTTQELRGVAYGSDSGISRFVAVGDGGTILTSADGTDWTTRSSGTSRALYGVAFANHQFVAVGEAGTVLASADGLAWTLLPSGVTQRLNAVSYGKDRWLAVGEGGLMLASTNGQASSFPITGGRTLVFQSLRSTAYGYGQFVAVGDTVIATADGQSASQRNTSLINQSVTFARGLFVAVRGTGEVAVSEDAAGWRTTASLAPEFLRAVGFFNSEYVAVSASGAIFTSADAGDWKPAAATTGKALNALAASPAAVIAVGAGGTIVRSVAAVAVPAIVRGPASVTAAVGERVVFNVVASGTAPLSYQWSQAGRPIEGATNDFLAVSSGAAGPYAVSVANAVGAVTSADASLTVIPAAIAPGDLMDPGFSAAGVSTFILPLPDGKLIVGGGANMLARLNADGSPDASFTSIPRLLQPSLRTVSINSAVRQPDGKILAAGASAAGGDAMPYIARFLSDGTLDTSFQLSGDLAHFAVTQIALQPNGKIMVVNGSSTLTRLNPDGSIDPSFVTASLDRAWTSAPVKWSGNITRIAIDPRGRVIFGANLNTSSQSATESTRFVGFARLLVDGAFDESFAPAIVAGTAVVANNFAVVSDVALHPDGRPIFCYSYIPGSNVTFGTWNVFRTFEDGRPDPSLVASDYSFRYGPTVRVGFDGTGRILVVARLYNEILPAYLQVRRYLPDGSRDTTLVQAGEIRFDLYGIAVLPSGETLVAGDTKLFRLRAANTSPSQRPVIFSESPPVITAADGNYLPVRVNASAVGATTCSWNILSTVPTVGSVPSFSQPFSADGLVQLPVRGSGVYFARLTNVAGETYSQPFFVEAVASPPAISGLPAALAAHHTYSPQLIAEIAGSGPLTCQWLRDGQPLDQPTTLDSGPYTLLYQLPFSSTGVVTGSYQLRVSSALGTVTSPPTVVTNAPRLANISTRAGATGGDNVLTVGFIVVNRLGYTKTLLLRGIGPGLESFGVAGVVPDPILTVYNEGGVKVLEQSGISSDPLYQFPTPDIFPATTRDTSVFVSLAPGSYTLQVRSKSGQPGIALAEVYESQNGIGYLRNVSSRALVGTGAQIAISGFVVKGTVPKKMLIRAVGPTLAAFGVRTAIADPQLAVLDSRAAQVAANDNWSPTAELADITRQVGAFPLAVGSRDAAIVVTLAPGAYTTQVTGVDGTAGVALVEAYEVP